MNSNDFDTWNREAILRAALEYRSSSESYRSELVYTETQLARVTAERDRLRKALEEIRSLNSANALILDIIETALQEDRNPHYKRIGMTDYTQGPWFVHDLRGMGGPISISCTTPDHITVADIGPGIENTEAEALANARLIAASPDLFEALEAMVGFYETNKSWESFWGQIQSAYASLELGKRALAKARGTKEDGDE